MQSSESLAPPAEKFGKYEIVRKLSRSMTDVYLARDTWTNQPVVLKRIEHSRDELTRIVIEAETRGAQIQRQLHNLDPRILEVYEFGEQNRCFFVAMEYFEGRTLAELLQTERRFEPTRAARYAAEICSQLRTLHSFFSDVNGRKIAVVHGDVKPSNVQIGLKDELKLLDFGIAKVITSTHHLTRHNLGSPSYCSPERLSKAQVDVYSDLWAVGVSLFEMLSGSPPYQALDTRQLENLIQSKRPPRALPEDCPAALKAIGAKALAADIENRYKSAEAFENDLRAFLAGRPALAESEHIAWDANATTDRQLPVLNLGVKPVAITKPSRNGTQTRLSSATLATKAAIPAVVRVPFHRRFVRHDIGNLTVALLAGLLAGLLIFMPFGYFYKIYSALAPLRSARDYAHEPQQVITSDWDLYQNLKQRTAFLGLLSPVSTAETQFRANLTSAADNVIDGFRGSSDSRLGDFDWSRAQMCLRYALQIDPHDTKAKGKLALCEGYMNLVQNPQKPGAAKSIDYFGQAASYLPKSPDPRLGLAYLYVYAYRNIGQALPEFQQAQRLGFQNGPRETAEQADGYRFRSEYDLDRARRATAKDRKDEAEKLLQLSRADGETARKLYEPLVGFANVSAGLDLLDQDRNQQNALEAELQPPPAAAQPAKSAKKAKPHATKRSPILKWWQRIWK